MTPERQLEILDALYGAAPRKVAVNGPSEHSHPITEEEYRSLVEAKLVTSGHWVGALSGRYLTVAGSAIGRETWRRLKAVRS